MRHRRCPCCCDCVSGSEFGGLWSPSGLPLGVWVALEMSCMTCASSFYYQDSCEPPTLPPPEPLASTMCPPPLPWCTLPPGPICAGPELPSPGSHMPSVSTLQHSYLKQLWYDFPPFSFPFRNHTEKEATQKKTHTRTLLSMPALPSCRCTHHFGTLFGSCSGEAGRRRGPPG